MFIPGSYSLNWHSFGLKFDEACLGYFGIWEISPYCLRILGYFKF